LSSYYAGSPEPAAPCLQVRHIAATPVGMRVTASAVVERCEGRTIYFRLEARDERELIGDGTHQPRRSRRSEIRCPRAREAGTLARRALLRRNNRLPIATAAERWPRYSWHSNRIGRLHMMNAKLVGTALTLACALVASPAFAKHGKQKEEFWTATARSSASGKRMAATRRSETATLLHTPKRNGSRPW